MNRELPLEEWKGWKGRSCSMETGDQIEYDFPYTADVRGYDCIKIELEEPLSGGAWLNVTLRPLPSGRPEFIGQTDASVCLPPGCTRACIPYSAFDYSELVSAHMKYISSMEMKLLPFGEDRAALSVRRIAFGEAGDFHIKVRAASQAGEAGERLEWQVSLENELDIPRYVTVTEKRGGRESLELTYPEQILLQPGETKSVTICAQMTEQLPRGGYEERTLEWIPDGDGSRHRTVTLYGARRMAHPVLLHTEKGWERVQKSVEKDPALRERFAGEYEKIADSWEVPKPCAGAEWVYESASQDAFLKTVVAWKVTGKKAWFEKALQYIKGFLDEERGYLATRYSYFQCVESREEYAKGTFPVRHAVSAGWVQEGEFMTKLAVACDLLWDRPEFTEEMHAKMEVCMRNYIEFESWRLTDGDGNNFQLSEASAALYFACLLQDYPMIRRFLEGTNGLYELLGSVLADDGSYFEGASNYMRLAAEILLHTAIACENLGWNLKDVWVAASHDRYVVHAPWAERKERSEDGRPFLGMSFERAGHTQRPVRKLKDFIDNLLQLTTPQGILFSVNDSNEQNMVPVMETAYYLYRDQAYLSVAERNGHRDILYGSHMLERGGQLGKSYLNTGNGFALLRDTKEGYLQAVMKYGQHGGYHGHYDRLSLVSLIRDGQTFHNMEFSWYTYGSFLFKMWVQTSLAHNMVVTDRRMQEPSECECIYFREGEEFQAVCAQTVSRWSDPPYGGQTPYPEKFPEEKCAREGRFILPPREKRSQGDIGTYSEPVFQRRLIILAGGCCFVWDYEEAEHEHSYECFYHPFGTMEPEGLTQVGFSEYLDQDPYGSGQFIRSCHWYESRGTVKLSVENRQRRVNPNDIMDFAEQVCVYGIYPRTGQVMIGRYPHRQDSFAAGENCGIDRLTETPCKKAVAFHQKGKNARFITALEMGEETIRKICCDSYEKVEIFKKDGSRWELTVRGMDQREQKEIAVDYRRTDR